jgi:hypothetical protein
MHGGAQAKLPEYASVVVQSTTIVSRRIRLWRHVLSSSPAGMPSRGGEGGHRKSVDPGEDSGDTSLPRDTLQAPYHSRAHSISNTET